MKQWWKKCRFSAAAVLTAGLLFCMGLPVQAAQESGNLTLCLKNKEHNVEFALYKAADIINDKYRLTGPFTQTGADLNHLEHAAEVEKCVALLYKAVVEGNIPADAGGITAGGKLQLKLEKGLYLVVQAAHEDDRLLVSPFLISVPLWDAEKGEWSDQVTAYPKSEEVKPEQKTEPPTQPGTAPGIPPVSDRPDDPDEPAVPNRGVLGALRQNIGSALEQAAGVLGARVRTGDESLGPAVFYILLAAAASGCMAFVVARRRKENAEK